MEKIGNDDLISRKEALERLRLLKRLNTTETIQIVISAAEQQINNCKTAFDKEKVMGKLRKWENESVDNRDWNHGDGLIDLCEIHEHHGARQAYKHAIEIVEKGESE